MIYLDTSVLGPLYWDEPLSGRIQRIIASSGPPAITQIGEVELVSVISRRVRTGELTRPDALRIVAQFQSNLDEGSFQRLPIEPPDYSRARDLIARFDTALRALDALHLAVVLHHQVTLLTADKALAKAAKRSGANVTLIQG